MGKTRYEKYMKKPEDEHKERLAKTKCYYAFSPERYEEEKKFYAEHGRSWHVFTGIIVGKNIRKTWIQQYEKKGKSNE